MVMERKHSSEEHKCDACEMGMIEYKRKERAAKEKYGWYAHYVSGNPDPRFANAFANAHTHNVQERFNHPDFQVVLNIDPQIIHSIFWNLIYKIKEGKSFKAGDKALEIIRDLPVGFIDATEGERKVLRIILPDAKGSLDEKEMELPYSLQFSNF